jgi:hypothetical protein
LPPRFKLNRDSGYAKYHFYPRDVASLEAWIEDAYASRVTRRSKIKNPRQRYRLNRRCP